MELLLVKEMIEKTLNEAGEEVLNSTSIEYQIKEGEDTRGSVNIAIYGVTFNLYGGSYNIAEWKTKIENLLNIPKK